jgi:hypothetical protein
MAVSPFREAALINRLHWRKRFGAAKRANELKIIFEAQPCSVRASECYLL